MRALSSNVLVLGNGVLVFLFDGTQAELVCQGHLKNSKGIVGLPIQMEAGNTNNLYTVRQKLNSYGEAQPLSDALAKLFDVVFPWVEPGYTPYDTGSPHVIRRI